MIPIKNVFYMLAYAFRALDRKAYRPLESEDFANAEDLLAAGGDQGDAVGADLVVMGLTASLDARRTARRIPG